jgi:hypothetical protein
MDIIRQDRELWKVLSYIFEDDLVTIILLYTEKRLWDYEDNRGWTPDSNYCASWNDFLRLYDMPRVCAFDWRLRDADDHEEQDEEDEEQDEADEADETDEEADEADKKEIWVLELQFSNYQPCMLNVTEDEEPQIREYLKNNCSNFRFEIDYKRTEVSKKRKECQN